MLRCCLWTSFLWFALIGSSHAVSKISDGDLIVTIKSHQPCFSYPLDEATKMTKYRLARMDIIWNDQASSLPGKHAWTVEARLNQDHVANPDSPEACIPYGFAIPGTHEKNGPAKIFMLDVPYHAHMSIFTESTSAKYYDRKYDLWFCMAHNAAGQPLIVKAKRNSATAKFECQDPEKEGNKNFFQRLFRQDAP